MEFRYCISFGEKIRPGDDFSLGVVLRLGIIQNCSFSCLALGASEEWSCCGEAGRGPWGRSLSGKASLVRRGAPSHFVKCQIVRSAGTRPL